MSDKPKLLIARGSIRITDSLRLVNADEGGTTFDAGAADYVWPAERKKNTPHAG